MTGVFDGMAGALISVFGAPVTIYPGGGSASAIRGVVRDAQVQVADREGEAPVWIVATTLRAQRADVASLVSGDVVEAEGDARYKVRYRLPSTSPAGDRFEQFILDEF